MKLKSVDVNSNYIPHSTGPILSVYYIAHQIDSVSLVTIGLLACVSIQTLNFREQNDSIEKKRRVSLEVSNKSLISVSFNSFGYFLRPYSVLILSPDSPVVKEFTDLTQSFSKFENSDDEEVNKAITFF